MRKGDERWLLLALLLLAFALRAGGLQFQSLWRDEVDSIRFAAGPAPSLLGLFASPGQNGPLYLLLLNPWLRIAGSGEFALRFPSAMAGTLAVALVYRLCARLLKRPWAAVVTAALAATSPYLVWYSQEGKMYALVVCAALLSTDCLVSALQWGGWQRWLGYVAATAVAFYVHIVAALLIPGQIVVFLALGRWRRRSCAVGFGASLAILSVPYLPLLAWQLPLLVRGGSTGYHFVSLPSMLGSLISAYTVGVAPTTLWLLVPGVGLLLAGAVQAGSGALAPIGRALVGWFLVPVVCFFVVTLLRPLYTARYLIFVLPAVWLLQVAGACRLNGVSRAAAGACVAAVLATNAYGLRLQASTPLKTDYRSATRYVAERKGAGDLILFQMPYARYSFDYYYSRFFPGHMSASVGFTHSIYLPLSAAGTGRYEWADGLYTNSGVSPEEVDRVMRELVSNARIVWLFESEAALWDERGLVRDWLSSHAIRTERTEFVRVVVYRYAFP